MNRTETASAAASRRGQREPDRAASVAPRRAARRATRLFAVTAALSLGLIGAAPGSTHARQANRSMPVGATVQPYVRIKATNPAQLMVANKDTSIGYMTVTNTNNKTGTTLDVQTNDRAGYKVLVQVAAASQSQFSSIEITGFGSKVVLPATGGTIAVPYSALNTTFTLTYRFVFAPKAKDGTFAWPLTFSAQPNP
ncbi:hypothetical protein [Burkholderia catarinensis]|uniref:hypothetical protein n=1 Tax=Burkholderia catarinensis TaxID=1108140 RepID=UPI00100819F1|nr:hypothetical protein [Burkholderia catarinensis]KAG8150336.1 hypothetical protein BFF94_028035 [Burkholderia catarinensis]